MLLLLFITAQICQMIIVCYSTTQKNDITIFARHFNGSHQGRTKWRNCRLTPKTQDCQLNWAIWAARRLMDTLKWNLCFMQWKFSQTTMLRNIKESLVFLHLVLSCLPFTFCKRSFLFASFDLDDEKGQLNKAIAYSAF